MGVTYEMVADNIVLFIPLSTWSLCYNSSPIDIVVVHNSEVNLVKGTLKMSSVK